MRTLQLALAAVATILVGIPFAIFLAAWGISGFSTATHWAAVYLLLWVIILGLVPLAISFALVWKGLPFVLDKTETAMAKVMGVADRIDRLAVRAGNASVRPNIWLHTRAAWLRAFATALWREFVPGRSRA